jgi:hypothetical protein
MSVKLCVDQIDKHPIAIEAYKFLYQRGMITPGFVVTKEYVEHALDKKYEPNCWKFLGAYLLLKAKIEAEGFFITQADIEAPGFKILPTEEMAEYCQKKLMKNLTSNFKLSYIMAAHDITKLDERGKKRHKLARTQAAQSALIQQKMLFDSTYF